MCPLNTRPPDRSPRKAAFAAGALCLGLTSCSLLSESIGEDHLLWSAAVYWYPTEYNSIDHLLPDASDRLFSTPEDLAELADALDEVVTDEPTDAVRDADTSDSSYVVFDYDACEGHPVEIKVNSYANPPVIHTRTFYDREVDCAAAEERIEVWEIPDDLAGEGAEVRRDHRPIN